MYLSVNCQTPSLFRFPDLWEVDNFCRCQINFIWNHTVNVLSNYFLMNLDTEKVYNIILFCRFHNFFQTDKQHFDKNKFVKKTLTITYWVDLYLLSYSKFTRLTNPIIQFSRNCLILLRKFSNNLIYIFYQLIFFNCDGLCSERSERNAHFLLFF